MSCGVDRRHSLELALLQLWCRLAAAAPIQPLAWEPPYATGAALKKKTKKIGIINISLQESERKKQYFFTTEIFFQTLSGLVNRLEK